MTLFSYEQASGNSVGLCGNFGKDETVRHGSPYDLKRLVYRTHVM